MSKIIGIAYKLTPGSKMIQKEKVIVSKDNGIEGDCRGTTKNAQITILDNNSWQKVCKDLNSDLSWLKRRTNLLIDKIDLKSSIGKKLYIGTDVILQIKGECKPCELMEKTHKGLFEALSMEWRGGVETIVLKDGIININDKVTIE